MKKILSTAFILVSFSLMIIGCTGPTGPQGNANVQSDNITVSNSNWTLTTSSPWEYSVTINDPKITQDIVDNGMVLVYISNGSGGWQLLPTIGYTTGTSGGYIYDLEWKYSPVYSTGAVTIWYYIVTDPTTWVPNNPGAQTFKIVAVAGLTKASYPNVDWNNYNEVKQALHLQD
jgi:hypothetical protein